MKNTLYSENLSGTDYRIYKTNNILDDKVTIEQLVKNINDLDPKSLYNSLTNKDYGFGIKEEDFFELVSIAKELSMPTYAEITSYKRYSWNAYERLMPEEEKVLITKFVEKLEKVYRDKGTGTKSDKFRNEIWDGVATNKEQFELAKDPEVAEAQLLKTKASERIKMKETFIKVVNDPTLEKIPQELPNTE